MDEDQGPQRAPIERLPKEILCEVLSALPDLVSLKTAAFSCPLFYSTFLIAGHSVRVRIQVHVTPLGRFQSGKAIIDFIKENMIEPPTLPRSWSLNEAIRIEQFHQHVEYWAAQYSPWSIPEGPWTEERIWRIHRALYRFETFCNLFRGHPNDRFLMDNFNPPEIKTFQASFYEEITLWDNVRRFVTSRVFEVAQAAEEARGRGEGLKLILGLGLERLRQFDETKRKNDQGDILLSLLGSNFD
ncbi:hypothetical protein GGR51DRAFT_570185 [Nemania sp. FL0031]|nr:hypothetical protein GGR51DRAFT_570185 [Nemania sp. FL0031]